MYPVHRDDAWHMYLHNSVESNTTSNSCSTGKSALPDMYTE